MQPLGSWQDVTKILAETVPVAERAIKQTVFYVKQYPGLNDNPEGLSTLLARLNVCVAELGELQPIMERVKNWTDRRYEIEKSLAAMRVIETGKAANYAKEAKYEALVKQDFLSKVVDSSSMYLRLQNARSTARDTTEALRSRISQIKGAQRSS